MVNFDRLCHACALFFHSRWFATCTTRDGFQHQASFDSSLLRSALILSSIVLWCLTSAILAVGLVVLFVRKRRQERAVNEFSEQVWQLTREAGAAGRIGLGGGPKALGRLGSAVNELLEDLEQRGA